MVNRARPSELNNFGEPIKPRDSSGAVDLWFIALDQEAARVRHFGETLTDSEQQRAQRFARQRDRARYVVGRYAMRKVLSRILNIAPKKVALGLGAHDKPGLIDHAKLGFNLSHSGGLAVLAVVDGSLSGGSSAPQPCEVGVDIESTQRLTDPETLFRHCLCKRELQGLLALNKDEQREVFFEIWVRKEACLKALGIGFEIEPHSFDSGWCFRTPGTYSDQGVIVNIADRSTTIVSQLKNMGAALEVLGFDANLGDLDGERTIPVSPLHWHGAIALVDKIPLPSIRRFEFHEG